MEAVGNTNVQWSKCSNINVGSVQSNILSPLKLWVWISLMARWIWWEGNTGIHKMYSGVPCAMFRKWLKKWSQGLSQQIQSFLTFIFVCMILMVLKQQLNCIIFCGISLLKCCHENSAQILTDNIRGWLWLVYIILQIS